ncbi:thioredoxin family protein [Dellaglioa algida]|uniref:Uncharacterized protein n=2 Tax=Dellaglioa algida TaxID=105612 RepID=A0A2C8EKL4_9LACO|nr:thioredoxin family protein [Dellaglioa algida]MDK1716579.1 thioredoxin family protein [Dellaglioa algida]MDK1717998.1 thioredoxin family protein [Dellaglioa algida]MDK1721521.1 thioredoxin family protein [Dellaglioa algida]MDK1724192.1 thioredoxin family protein [Dellaglioa algida]MDK1724891.1 thioredoxin family protein [Dellaglioa algida]
MKKIIISIVVILFTGFLGMFIYHNMTYEKTYFNYTHFKEVPKLVKKKKKIIVFAIQDGCSYCKMVEPIVNEYAKKNDSIVYAIVTNKETDYTEAEKYKIKGTPTLIFYRNGKEIFRRENGFTNDQFQQIIHKLDF